MISTHRGLRIRASGRPNRGENDVKARPRRRRHPSPAPPAEEKLRLDACWHWEGRTAAEDVNAVLGFVAEAMDAADYPDRDLFAVRLALAEALSNALRHGHRGDPTRPVRVRHHVDARRVLVEVEDQGDGFDPARVPDPRAPENRERPGGRGLVLMRAYMTWVRYNGRGNCVTMCKDRSARPTGA